MAQTGQPWRLVKDGLVVSVRLTPKASRDAVRGLEATADGLRLAITVRAVPGKGEANAALLVALAKWLGVPKTQLSLASGGKSRSKSVVVAGDPAQIVRLLQTKLQLEV